MKIRKLHIKNYKVFDDLELDFTDADGKTLDKVVLAGVNGCGKTTVLEIIAKIVDGTIYDYFRMNLNSSIEIEIELTTKEKKECQGILHIVAEDLQFNNEHLSESQLIFSFPLISEASLVFLQSLRSKISTLLYMPVDIFKNKVANGNNVRIIHLSSYIQNIKATILERITDDMFKNKHKAPFFSIEKEINEINSILSDMNLTTKLVDFESKELVFDSVNGKRILFEDLSTGEQTLYFRSIYLNQLSPKNTIILIDQPEESLHPTWQQKVLQLYQNIGENNQVIVATHSPHIIGACKAEEVFLLEIEGNHLEAVHPKYTKGHSIDYILEVMGTDPNDTVVINIVDDYLTLMRKGLHETERGLKLKTQIDALNLDPNSEEMRRLDLSMRRIKVIGV